MVVAQVSRAGLPAWEMWMPRRLARMEASVVEAAPTERVVPKGAYHQTPCRDQPRGMIAPGCDTPGPHTHRAKKWVSVLPVLWPGSAA